VSPDGAPATLGRRPLFRAGFVFYGHLCLNGMSTVGAQVRKDRREAPVAEPAVGERVLLAALAGGDREAANALVERTYRKVFALLCRISGSPDLAADLTQETYRRAWAALATFDGRAQFSTWLYRIATNTFLNHVRRPRAVEPLSEEHERTVPDGALRQDDGAIAAQIHERLRRAVLALPEELRFTVTARFWGEAPVAEIARAEGISEVAIRKRLRRAYRMLAVVLQEVAP
jgi:RNA polymerase sigma-70 factor (ECF subfamily)